MSLPNDRADGSHTPSPRFQFHQMDSLAELANLVDAAPVSFRADLLWSALNFEPSETFEQSLNVGSYRTLVWDALTEACGSTTLDGVRHVVEQHSHQIKELVQRLNDATDLARVQLVLCDLVLLLAAHLSPNDDA